MGGGDVDVREIFQLQEKDRNKKNQERDKKMMKALLFNGFSKNDSNVEMICSLIIKELNRNGFEVEEIILRDKNIAACQGDGCLDCWSITPGVCKIRDYGQETAKKWVNSNLVIHFTPITFGGYSFELKKVIDRFIPIVLPFCTKRNGEIHHKYRYKNRSAIIAIGVLDKPDEEKQSIFEELVHRNSLTMGAPVHKAIIYTKIQSKTDFTNKFSKILKEVEAKA